MLVFIFLYYGQTKNIYMAQGETLTRNYNFLDTSAEKVKHDRISEKIKEIIASSCLTGCIKSYEIQGNLYGEGKPKWYKEEHTLSTP